MSKYFKETKEAFILSPDNDDYELHFYKTKFKTLKSVVIAMAKEREKNREIFDSLHWIAIDFQKDLDERLDKIRLAL